MENNGGLVCERDSPDLVDNELIVRNFEYEHVALTMSPTLIFRPATNQDAPKILPLVLGSRGDFSPAREPGSLEGSLQDIEGQCQRRGGTFEVIENPAGEIVGTIGLYPLDQDCAKMSALSLAPTLRSASQAKLLLDHAVRKAKVLVFSRVVVDASILFREAADLLPAIGFRLAGTDRSHPDCSLELWPHIGDPARFRGALRQFDQENAQDPHHEHIGGLPRPRELLAAQRLMEWVLRLRSEASEALLLASRSQHICRWMIPRNAYPMTRAGYLRWRTELKSFHAQKSGEILRAESYPEAIIARVQALNLKKDFPSDPETRVLEDALCLVFLQYQLAELAAKTDEDKVINALQKSWKKMTATAQRFALELPFTAPEMTLVERALSAQHA